MEEDVFNNLSDSDKFTEIFRLGKKTHDIVSQHDPVIKRLLGYEKAGIKTGKWLMRIFTGGIIAGITVWITNHWPH